MAGRLRNSSAEDTACIKCEETKLMECECLEKKKRDEILLSVNGATSTSVPKKKKKKTFNEMSKPY